MRTAIITSLTLGLSLAACGSDLCDRYVALSKNGIAEATACGASTTATYNAAACKQDETNCSDADKKTVGIYLDCLSNLKSPSCSASASTADKNAALATYGQAASACATSSSIGSLSSACQKALSAAVTTDNSVTLP